MLSERIETAKAAKPATAKPALPTLFVPNGNGYRPATEAEIWAALDALTRKAA